jgi:hypothetical protein
MDVVQEADQAGAGARLRTATSSKRRLEAPIPATILI